MKSSIAVILLTPALAMATSVEYYRSAFCDAQSPNFFIERFLASSPLADDKACHQTPARTMAMKLVDGLDPDCIVLAYDDYACTSLVGSVPANGKCVAATKAKIGSWQARCNTTQDQPELPTNAGSVSGELKRRGKMRRPSIRDAPKSTISHSNGNTTDATIIASSVASEISSAVNASATKDIAATITSSPSAGAALSSAISSGTGIDFNLTSYVTASINYSYVAPTMTTTASPSAVTFIGTTGSNGTAVLHLGGSSSNQLARGRMLTTILCGMIALLGAAVM